MEKALFYFTLVFIMITIIIIFYLTQMVLQSYTPRKK